jgi:LPXTG-site transpeptidase (sortase) family protein
MRQMSPRVRVAVIAAAALLGAVGTLLVLNQQTSGTTGDSSAFPTPSADQSPVETDEPSAGPAGTTTDPDQPSSPTRTFSADLEDNRPERGDPPTSVAIPAVELDLPVRPMGVDSVGAMALPDTVNALSWYKFGSAPTDEGATVIAGHIDTKSEGIGPLSTLKNLSKDDLIRVTVGKQTVEYRIEDVRQVSKSLLDLEALFRRSGPSRLHLVTCGGTYDRDRGGYQANLVVVAKPVRS